MEPNNEEKHSENRRIGPWKQMRNFFHFDTTGVLMKLSYFFVQGKQGAITPYLIVFLTSTGLHLKESSLISGLQFVGSIISTQIFGWIADKTGRRAIVFICITTAATAVIFPLPWMAKSVFNIDNTILNGTNKTNRQTPSDIQELYQSKLFFVMLLLVNVGFLFSNPLNGFVDSFVMNIVRTCPGKFDYGEQRLFGSLGFGTLNLLCSVVSEYDIDDSVSPYLGVFLIFLPAMLLLIPSGVVLERRGEYQIANTDNVMSKLFKIFLNISNLMFLLSFFVAGIGNAAIIGFLFKFMKDELNASKTLMGIGMLVASIGDILILLLSSRLLHVISDPINGVIIAVFSYFVRFILILYLKSPVLIVLTQLLNGPSFALCWAAGSSHAKVISPPEVVVSIYSLLNNVFFNVAGVVGFIGGGEIYSRYGAHNFFLAMACFSGISFLIMVLYFHVILRLFCTTKNVSVSNDTLDTESLVKCVTQSLK